MSLVSVSCRFIPNKNSLGSFVNGGKNVAMLVVCVWWQHHHLCISVGVRSLTYMYTGSNVGGNLADLKTCSFLGLNTSANNT